jgi:hypothetical protein
MAKMFLEGNEKTFGHKMKIELPTFGHHSWWPNFFNSQFNGQQWLKINYRIFQIVPEKISTITKKDPIIGLMATINRTTIFFRVDWKRFSC